jgi:predicted ATPase
MPEAEGTRAGPIVGRRQELASLEAALDALRSPRGRWLALGGEPGTGKTRLLAELDARAQARDHLVLVGRGSELERDLPFGIWVAALDDHVALLGADRVEALVGNGAAELGRVLPSAATAPAVASGGLQDERFRAHRAVRALLGGWRRASRWCSSSTTSTGPTRRRSSSSSICCAGPLPLGS